jgi:hypothetical protein
MWTDYYLRGDTEADLIAALPMLRFHNDAVTDKDGNVVEAEQDGWETSGQHHAIDVMGACILSPAVMSEDGETVVTPAEIDERFHVNLRLRSNHPDHAEIVEAIAPFVVTPGHPRQVWAA